MNKNSNTFNGAHTTDNTSGTITYPFENKYINDPITYCPFCGKHLIMDTDEIKYCPFCGKAIPRTYTGGSYIIHWNYPDGTPSYPLGSIHDDYGCDGIIKPITIC